MRFTAVVMGISITVIWILGFFVALPELLYQKLGRTYPSQFTEYLTYCTLELVPYDKQAYQMFLTSGLYGFPMCLMFFAYSIIGVRLCKSSFPGTHETQNGLKGRRSFSASRPESHLQARRKAAKMLMTIVVLFALCYLPVHVLNILRYCGVLHIMNPISIVTFALTSRGLCYFNSAVNPLIYNFMSAKFRQEFRSAIRTCRSPCRRKAKVPITIYNYRGHRSFQLNRTTERYSMNTLTSRQHVNPKSLKSKKTTALDKV